MVINAINNKIESLKLLLFYLSYENPSFTKAGYDMPPEKIVK